jgi:flagellar hook-associated protein 1 FlgK
MSVNVLSIGATGLNAAQVAISTAQNNIANASTPGYHSVNVNSTAIPLSLGGGVEVTLSSSSDLMAERAYNNSLVDQQATNTVLDTASRVQNLTTNSQVSADWQNFFTSVTNFQLGSSPSNLTQVNDAGQKLSSDFKNWQGSVSAIIGETDQQMKTDQSQYMQLQVQALSVTDPTAKSQIMQQISTLQGKLQGEGQVVTQLPQLISSAKEVMQSAMQKVNSQMGTTVFDSNSNYHSMTANNVSSGSLSAIDVSAAIAAVLERVTTEAQNASAAKQSADVATTQQQIAINKAYGVNLTNEAVKVTQAQQLAQAMTNIMAVSNAMFDYFIKTI